MASKITAETIKGKKKHEVLDLSYLDFKLKFVNEDFVMTFLFEYDEVAEQSSPVDVTKGWIRATTKRPENETKDYIYVHPKCPKQLRFMEEVKMFINMEYDLVPSKKNPVYRLLNESEVNKEKNKKKTK